MPQVKKADLEGLFAESTDTQFNETMSGFIAVHMTQLYIGKVKTGYSKTAKCFADEFFKERNKYFGASASLYLKFCKLAVAYDDGKGGTKFMTYASFYRYMDDLIRKSINFQEECSEFLNGYNVKRRSTNLTGNELEKHFEEKAVKKIICLF